MPLQITFCPQCQVCNSHLYCHREDRVLGGSQLPTEVFGLTEFCFQKQMFTEGFESNFGGTAQFQMLSLLLSKLMTALLAAVVGQDLDLQGADANMTEWCFFCLKYCFFSLNFSPFHSFVTRKQLN